MYTLLFIFLISSYNAFVIVDNDGFIL